MELNRRTFLKAGAGVGAAGLGVAAYSTLVEPNRVEFSRHSTGLGTPRFVQISDLHLRELSDMHSAISREVTKFDPAFIVITGDSVDTSDGLGLFSDFLHSLPSVEKYIILGNWEHWGGVDPASLRRIAERASGRVLINESAVVKDIELCGIDDLIAGKPDVAATLKSTSGSRLRLLLAHCPGHRDVSAVREAPIDAILSGHTHGGQVKPFGHALVKPPGSGKYISGWYKTDGHPMYVSRGIGTSVLPVRFGARPEVILFG